MKKNHRKTYKLDLMSKIRMLPGDPTGSPDDIIFLFFMGVIYGRKIGFY